MIVHPAIQRPGLIFCHRIRRHGQHRQVLETRVLADLSRGGITIHDWHLHIHQHAVKVTLFQFGQRFLTIVGDIHDYRDLLQQLCGNLQVDFRVIDHQNSRALYRCQVQFTKLAPEVGLMSHTLTKSTHNGIEQRRRIDRFGQDIVYQVGVIDAVHVARRHQDNLRWIVALLNRGSHIQPADTRHHPVHQNQIERLRLLEEFQSLFTTFRQCHLVTE